MTLIDIQTDSSKCFHWNGRWLEELCTICASKIFKHAMEHMMVFNPQEGEELTLMDTEGGIMIEHGNMSCTIPDQQLVLQQQQQPQQRSAHSSIVLQQHLQQQAQPTAGMQLYQQQRMPQHFVQQQQSNMIQQRGHAQVQHVHQQHLQRPQVQQMQQQIIPQHAQQQIHIHRHQLQQSSQDLASNVQQATQQQQLSQQTQQHQSSQPNQQSVQQQMQHQPNQMSGLAVQQSMYSAQPQYIVQHPSGQVVVQQPLIQGQLIQQQGQQRPQQHLLMQQQVIQQQQAPQLIVQSQRPQQALIPSKPIIINQLNKAGSSQLVHYFHQPPPTNPNQITQQRQTIAMEGFRKHGVGQQQQTPSNEHTSDARVQEQRQLGEDSSSEQQVVQLSIPSPQPQQHYGQQHLLTGQVIQEGHSPQQITYIHQAVPRSDGVQYQLRLASPCPVGNAGTGGIVTAAGVPTIIRPAMRPGQHSGSPQQQHPQGIAILAASMQHSVPPSPQQQQIISSSSIATGDNSVVDSINSSSDIISGQVLMPSTSATATPATTLTASQKRSRSRQARAAVTAAQAAAGDGGNPAAVSLAPGSALGRGANTPRPNRMTMAPLVGRGGHLSFVQMGQQRMPGAQMPTPVQRAPVPGGMTVLRPPTPTQLMTPANRMPRYASPNTPINHQLLQPSSEQFATATTEGTVAGNLTTTAEATAVISTPTSVNTSTVHSGQIQEQSVAQQTTTSTASSTGQRTKLSIVQYRNRSGARAAVAAVTPHSSPAPQPREQLLKFSSTGSEQHPIISIQHDQQQQPDTTSADKPQDNAVARKFVPGHQVMCVNCGILNDDFNTCQRCKKEIPKNARVVQIATPTAVCGPTSSVLPGLGKQEFYGKSGGGRRSEKPLQYHQRQTYQPHHHHLPHKSNSSSGQRGRGRGRTRAYDEPEILTLSSDEEEDKANGSHALGHPLSGSPAVDGAPLGAAGKSPSAVSDTAGISTARPVQNHTHGHGENLRNRMATLAPKEPFIEPYAEQVISSSCKMDVLGTSEDKFCRIVCRSLKIGSYRSNPKGPVIFSPTGILLPVASLKDQKETVLVGIDNTEILKMFYTFAKSMPAMFLYVKAVAAARIRNKLQMNDPSKNYFDSASKDETVKRIVIMPEKITDESREVLNSIYGTSKKSAASHDNSHPKGWCEEISQEDANAILMTGSSEDVQAILRNTARFHKDPLPQPSKTLLIYPPPPHKGGISITVDDYSVLEEESFLNDVILDFYLQYVLLNKLSDEQRAKVHLFSTFFYKRLTSKPKKMRRHHPIEDDPKLSAAEKRHSRVKSWTKSVNIFEKDFIIIPINEHAHWFLAIICFPGLPGPVHFDSGELLTAEQLATLNRYCCSRRRGRLRSRTEIPIIDDGEWSDRDEAEGDEDELEDEDDEDSNSSLPPLRKKPREAAIPGLGNGEERSTGNASTSQFPRIKQPCILIFDSLSGSNRSRIVATLRDYLSVEYLLKCGQTRAFTRDTMKGACPRVPQQTNYSDCGLYTLQFTESFFEMPLLDYRLPMRSLNHWFNQSIVAGKREAIACLIQILMKKLNPNNNIKLPDIYFNTAEERERGGRASCQIEERERLERLALENCQNEKNKNSTADPGLPNNEKIPLLGNDGANSAVDGAPSKVGGELANSSSNAPVLSENKTKVDGVSECSGQTESHSMTNENSGNKPNNAVDLKSSKPALLLPTSEAFQSITSGNKTMKPVAGKKLVLGSIPSVKPFGSVSLPSKPSVAVSSSPGLAAIQKCYGGFDDDDEPEDNNNESPSQQKLRAQSNVIEAVGGGGCEAGGVVLAVRATSAATASVHATGIKTVACGVASSVPQIVIASEALQSTTSPVLSAVNNASLSQILAAGKNMSKDCFMGQATSKTPGVNDAKHVTKVANLSFSSSTTLSNAKTILCKVTNDTAVSRTGSDVALQQCNNVTAQYNHVTAVSNKLSNPETVLGGAEAAANHAETLDEKSVLFMHLTEEDSKTSPHAADRSESLSPDLYSDLEMIPSSTAEDEQNETMSSSGSAGGACESAASCTSASASGPACFKFNERGTSSGRVISTPKRFLESTSTSEHKRRKKTKNTFMPR